MIDPIGSQIRSLWWADDALYLVDQTRLPLELVSIACRSAEAVADAIRTMRVRGAPAIGVAAAFGMALGLLRSEATGPAAVRAEAERVRALLGATRPTAANLFWALERQRRLAHARDWPDARALGQALLEEAQRLAAEDEAVNHRLGAHGAALVPPRARILTHCNAGALACVRYGTALGVIRAAHAVGRVERVWVDETRPFLQGARLTAWELVREGIPATLIVDSAAGQAMRRGLVDMVVVGADRTAANGDTANKTRTYTLAVLAHEHGVPFYVAAPLSTIDLALPDGDAIPIEERPVHEVTHVGGRRIAPEGVEVSNPAFDVTPSRYIAGIITERGIARPPYTESLAALARADLEVAPR